MTGEDVSFLPIRGDGPAIVVHGLIWGVRLWAALQSVNGWSLLVGTVGSQQWERKHPEQWENMPEAADFVEMLSKMLDFCEEVKHSTGATKENRFAATPHDCSPINRLECEKNFDKNNNDSDPRLVEKVSSPEKNWRVFGC